MTPRDLLEKAGVIWTRRERRRLARADAAPGRRFAGRTSRVKPFGYGMTRDSVEIAALIAAPGLRRRDIAVREPEPGTVRVELSGPRVTAEACAAVEEALEYHAPLGIALEVVGP